MKKPKRPRDTNQLAKFLVGQATGYIPGKTDDGRNPAAVALAVLASFRAQLSN